MTVGTMPLIMKEIDICQMVGRLMIRLIFMGQRHLEFMLAHFYRRTLFAAYVVSCGHHKQLIGQQDKETTAGQNHQLLIVFSAMDVMWFLWHIVGVVSVHNMK